MSRRTFLWAGGAGYLVGMFVGAALILTHNEAGTDPRLASVGLVVAAIAMSMTLAARQTGLEGVDLASHVVGGAGLSIAVAALEGNDRPFVPAIIVFVLIFVSALIYRSVTSQEVQQPPPSSTEDPPNIVVGLVLALVVLAALRRK